MFLLGAVWWHAWRSPPFIDMHAVPLGRKENNVKENPHARGVTQGEYAAC